LQNNILSNQIVSKGEQSRTEILLAAKQLIAARGFNAITLQDVLEAANVTKGKFFHHFSSKEDLFSELLRFSLSERSGLRFEDLLKDCPSPRASDRLLFLLDKIIEWHTKGLPDVMRLCLFSTFFFAPDSPELQRVNQSLSANTKILEGLLRTSQKDGDLPDTLNSGTWSLLFASAAVGGNLVGFLCGERDLTSKTLVELRKAIVIFKSAGRKEAVL
jgi:AcrR family transcriptional regulator